MDAVGLTLSEPHALNLAATQWKRRQCSYLHRRPFHSQGANKSALERLHLVQMLGGLRGLVVSRVFRLPLSLFVALPLILDTSETAWLGPV
ncbi:hypothetical protein HaLaN_24461 [Haematococcus lacustris]|uniref:Uncharacterized protein n=1 Tax=Haematococcus lacustris TaxID=44745 RepID=A0A6A0A3F0_HAELA|nr:hypothetical protein HaLaN_24461 [Haematococcus lacustris]